MPPKMTKSTPAKATKKAPQLPLADLNHDCVVDLRDFAVFQNSMIAP